MFSCRLSIDNLYGTMADIGLDLLLRPIPCCPKVITYATWLPGPRPNPRLFLHLRNRCIRAHR